MKDFNTYSLFYQMHNLHSKGGRKVKFGIILYIYQIDHPQKLPKLIMFYKLTLIVSEMC